MRSRTAWVLAFVAAFLAQFTEPVCCALSPDVCCAGELLGVPGQSVAPTSDSPRTTNRSQPGCSGCCRSALVDASNETNELDPGWVPVAAHAATGDELAEVSAKRNADWTHRDLSAEAPKGPRPAPIQTCGCERDRGTANAGSDAGSYDGKQDGHAWAPRDVAHVSPRSFVPARRPALPRERWKTDTPPAPLRI